MRNFINISLILLAIVCMSNSSCSEKSLETIRTSAFNEPFELSLEEQVILPKDSKEIIVNLSTISDSRCPENVVCVWAGNAIAELSLMSDNGAKTSVSLCIGDCRDKSSSSIINLGNNTYEVDLTGITTDRSGGNVKSRATVIVKKR